MKTTPTIVIDASLAIFNVLDTPFGEMASRVWEKLLRERASLAAPSLWQYEVTSVIHKYLFEKKLERDEAQQALDIILNFSINLVEGDSTLCHSAFQWADVLGQKAAYDGFYLALAEKLNADFWTADEHLVNLARQRGVTWVHWMGEATD